MVLVSFSVMAKTKGLLAVKFSFFGPAEVNSISTLVTAAASVPFSSTSINVLCFTFDIFIPPFFNIPVKLAEF